MAHLHCPMCGAFMTRTGRVPIIFPRVPALNRVNYALVCSDCSCVTEIAADETLAVMEFRGLRLPHLKKPWPQQFVEYTAITPRGMSLLHEGES